MIATHTCWWACLNSSNNLVHSVEKWFSFSVTIYSRKCRIIDFWKDLITCFYTHCEISIKIQMYVVFFPQFSSLVLFSQLRKIYLLVKILWNLVKLSSHYRLVPMPLRHQPVFSSPIAHIQFRTIVPLTFRIRWPYWMLLAMRTNTACDCYPTEI